MTTREKKKTERSGAMTGRRLPARSWLLGAAVLVPCAASLTWLSCGSELNSGTNGGDLSCNASALRVIPDNDILEVDLAMQPATRSFRVDALCDNGTTVDVTSRVSYTLNGSSVGTLNGATFTSATQTAAKVDFATVDVTYSDGDKMLSGGANLTVVWLRKSGPQQDFFFSLPYSGGQQDKPLNFSTNIKSLDVFFGVDTTSSMLGEIQNLSQSLQTKIIPDVKARAVNNAYFGVGAIDDFPYTEGSMTQRRYGAPNFNTLLGMPYDDQPFILVQPMTGDVAAAQSAVGQLTGFFAGATRPRGFGEDRPEGQIEGLYQIATGEGFAANAQIPALNVPANHAGLGGVAFRKGALPVVPLITDAAFHTKGEVGRICPDSPVTSNTEYAGPVATIAHTRSQALTALNNICAKVIGIASVSGGIDVCSATPDLVSFAQGTGALVSPSAWDVPARPAGCTASQCCTGLGGTGEAPDANGQCPLVFKIPSDGTGLGDQVTTGIVQVARYTQFNVTTQIISRTTADDGSALPAGKTTADFIKAVLPVDSTPPPAPPTFPKPTIMGPTFTKVVPGSTLQFTVSARNDFVMPASRPLVFRATIRVQAGGCADLDEREVLIVVAPRPPVIG